MRLADLRSALWIAAAAGIATLAAFAHPEIASAHTEENAPLSHVILDVGLWSLGAAAVIGLLVAVFWLRARRRGFHE